MELSKVALNAFNACTFLRVSTLIGQNIFELALETVIKNLYFSGKNYPSENRFIRYFSFLFVKRLYLLLKLPFLHFSTFFFETG